MLGHCFNADRNRLKANIVGPDLHRGPNDVSSGNGTQWGREIISWPWNGPYGLGHDLRRVKTDSYVLQSLGVEDNALKPAERAWTGVEISLEISRWKRIMVLHFMRVSKNDHVVFLMELDRMTKIFVGIIAPMSSQSLVALQIAVIPWPDKGQSRSVV